MWLLMYCNCVLLFLFTEWWETVQIEYGSTVRIVQHIQYTIVPASMNSWIWCWYINDDTYSISMWGSRTCSWKGKRMECLTWWIAVCYQHHHPKYYNTIWLMYSIWCWCDTPFDEHAQQPGNELCTVTEPSHGAPRSVLDVGHHGINHRVRGLIYCSDETVEYIVYTMSYCTVL